MSAPIDLRPDHAKLARDILAKHLPTGVSVRVFGSRAKWTAKTHSDLDLALKSAERLPPRVVAAVAEAFEESALPFKVDVLDWRAVAPELQAVIEREGVEFHWKCARPWRMSNWGTEVSLEYGKAIRDYSTARGEYRVFGSNGPIGWTDRPLTKGPGIILGRKGAYRGIRFSKEPFFVIDTAYYVVPKTQLDMRWLYYAIINHKLGEIDDGSPIPSTTRAAVYVRDLEVPPPEEQRSIASVLGALDDKIELNRRMNETLEATARAIFKDWFVDFGPVRAKMAIRGEDPQKDNVARAPYLAPDIWSLFPEALDEDGKPPGWNSEAVYEQAIWVNGAAYKDMHFSSEPDALPVVKIAELKSGITKTTRFTNTDLGDRYKIRDGELLFSWSGNPDTSIDTFVWTSGTAWLNQHIFAVRLNGKRSQGFLYAMLKFLRGNFAEIARNKQTTGLGHVTQQDLIRLKITAPSSEVAAAFDEIVGPLHARFTSNLFENLTLAATRDYLLPKLMSGEVRVKDAEKLVGEVI